MFFLLRAHSTIGVALGLSSHIQFIRVMEPSTVPRLPTIVPFLLRFFDAAGAIPCEFFDSHASAQLGTAGQRRTVKVLLEII